MDQKRAVEIIKKYIRHLRKNKYDVGKAYLFGSYAKGNFNEYSDIDIVLVIKNRPDSFDLQVELLNLTWDIDTRIEPHLLDEEDLNTFHPLADEIKKYGIEVKIN